MSKNEKIAVVRVRGIRNMDPKLKVAFDYLRLHKPNHCILLNVTAQNAGALNKIKDYVTFGSINEETLMKLLHKRGEKGGKKLSEIKKEDEIKNIATEIFNGKKLSDYADPVFRLHAPRGGYKDIKRSYPTGDLGKRDDINELLKRMM